MMAMLSIIVGPFIYFASIAASKEKTKTKE
jgi:hypothetical protein